MISSAELLSGEERCARIPWWGKDWKLRRMKPVAMIEAGVRAGLSEQTRSDFGELAGEEVYGMGSDPGLDSKQYDQHSEVVHLACLADVITCAIRKQGSEPWRQAPDVPGWTSGCYLSGDGHLRRILLVTSWSDDRHYSVCRDWGTLGEVCAHGLPMQVVVVNLGQHRDGRYHSYWAHGLRHPANKKLRFRKRNNINEPFKESWIEVWREDYDEIKTSEWLQGMLDDSVLADLLLRIDVPVPKAEHRQRIVDLAGKKLAIIEGTTELPMQQLSTCDWPTPCVMRSPCHAQEEPSPAYGFVRITA